MSDTTTAKLNAIERALKEQREIAEKALEQLFALAGVAENSSR